MAYDLCEICGDRVVRDIAIAAKEDDTSYWLGLCACPARKWRWKSATGGTPWILIGRPG